MPQRVHGVLLSALAQLLEAGGREAIADFLDGLDPGELLHLLNQLDDPTFLRLLRVAGRQQVADLLATLDPQDAARHMERLEISQAADVAERMDPDDAADVISELGSEGAAQILAEMEPQESQEVRQLLTYPPQTAGGLMTPEFVSVKAHWKAGETIRYLRTQAREAEMIYYIYATDREGRLRGVVSLRDLILAGEQDELASLLNEDVIFVRAEDDQEQVARVIQEQDLLALPVVDAQRRLVGIVTVDDVLDVLEAEYSEDILKFSAIEGEERPLTPAAYSIRNRLPWLLVNIVLSQIGILVVTAFQSTLAQVVVLATFMPAISNMGGNVGIQAVSVAIRGIATGDVAFYHFWRVLRKEVIVGFSNGLILGGLLGTVAFAWHRSLYLGIVTTLGLWANVLLASLCGGTLPFLLKRLGWDPAMMTGPLLTTIVDVFSFLIFLGLGTLLLPLR